MGIILRQEGKTLKYRNDDSFYNVRIGISIHPKFQAVLDVATTNGFITPNINGLRAGSALAQELEDGGYFENSAVIFVSTWNDVNMENFSRIDWKRLIVSNYLGGYTYEDEGVRGNKINGFHNYNFNAFTANDINYQLNDACDVYFRKRKKSTGGTNTVEGLIGNNAHRMDFSSTDGTVVRNKIFSGNTDPTIIDSFVRQDNALSESPTGGMYKRRISNSQIIIGDKIGEQPLNSNSVAVLNIGSCGLRHANAYYDHTQAFVWKGKGTFMTNSKFNEVRGYLNEFYSRLGISQNA